MKNFRRRLRTTPVTAVSRLNAKERFYCCHMRFFKENKLNHNKKGCNFLFPSDLKNY